MSQRMQVLTVRYQPDSPPIVEKRLPAPHGAADMPVLMTDAVTPHRGSTMLLSILRLLERRKRHTHG